MHSVYLSRLKVNGRVDTFSFSRVAEGRKRELLEDFWQKRLKIPGMNMKKIDYKIEKIG